MIFFNRNKKPEIIPTLSLTTAKVSEYFDKDKK